MKDILDLPLSSPVLFNVSRSVNKAFQMLQAAIWSCRLLRQSCQAGFYTFPNYPQLNKNQKTHINPRKKYKLINIYIYKHIIPRTRLHFNLYIKKSRSIFNDLATQIAKKLFSQSQPRPRVLPTPTEAIDWRKPNDSGLPTQEHSGVKNPHICSAPCILTRELFGIQPLI